MSNMEYRHDVGDIHIHPCVEAHRDGGDGISFLQEKPLNEDPKSAWESGPVMSTETEEPDSEMPAAAGQKPAEKKDGVKAHQPEVCAVPC